MTRSLFPLLLIFSCSSFAATPLKWSETMVKDLRTKTLTQVFCETNPGYQTKASCDYFKKNKMSLDERVTEVNVEDSSLFVTVGKRRIEIERTADAAQFIVNRKVIDLKKFRDPAALVKALHAAFPKVASGSLWMNSAYAQQEDLTTYEVMERAATLMLQSSFDQSWCKDAASFVKACNVNLSTAPEKSQFDMITGKIRNKKTLNSDDWRWLQADVDNFRFMIYKMQKLGTSLSKSETQNYLKSCPSTNRPALENAKADMEKCEKILTLKSLLLKEIPPEVENQQKYLKQTFSSQKNKDLVQEHLQGIVDYMDYVTMQEPSGQTQGVKASTTTR